MATTFTETTLSSTYKDDFRDSDNYHRILFNTGVGLQARELTQLQTILQKQIERFGNNIFKEGAVVKPGGVNINPQYEFIKLDETDPSHVMPTDVTTLVGKTVTGQTSGIIATILEAVTASGGDPATLYVKYTNTSSAQGSTDIVTQRMTSNEIMDVSDGTDLKVKLSTLADPSTGKGTQVTLLNGIYYARGNFVLTNDQSKIISKYTDRPSTDIGFKAVEQTITASDENALYDNQGAVPNVSAPGADRYRISLTIAERSEIGVNENFIHVATIKKGQIFNAVSTNDSYNIPTEVVARRIHENSGDYVVKPFTARFTKDSESTHLLLEVSDGTVVVDGFRSSRAFPSTLRVPKPTSTVTVNNEPVNAPIGSHVIVNAGFGGTSAAGTTQGIPNFNQLEEMNLRSAVTHGGSTIGTARIRAITKDGSNLKIHLIDINMNSGQAFRNVKSIGTSTDNFFDLVLENSKAVIKEPFVNTSLFKLPRVRPSSLTDLTYTAQRKFSTLSANSSGVIALTGLTAPGEIYTQTSDFVFAKADSDVAVTSPTISLSGGGTGGTADFGTGGATGSIASSSNIELSSFVSKTQTSPKTKTLTDFNLTNTVESDGSGFKFINLKRADIFEINEIVNASDSNENYLNRFILDDGQRPSHYDTGRLILKAGSSAPSGNVFVKYKFFEPSASGDYFSVNSYSGQVDYDKIPSFRLAGGGRVNLRDVIDFRSVADSAGNFNSAGATLLEVPKDGTTITSDVTYNLAQSAKLVIDRQSKLLLVQGSNGFLPTTPEAPDNTLPLYDIVLNPATFNDSDVFMSKYDFKRFTMKDIGRLEKRVEKLEEVATLNMLELDTKFLQVLDSAGNDRTKSGFFVDTFKTHQFSEQSTLNEYRAAIDVKENILRPRQTEEHLRLIYDSANSSNVIKKGDNVYIKYDEEEYIDQGTASSSIKINPFAVTIYDGTITLSPASDEWRDVERTPDKLIPGGTLLSFIPSTYFNDHIHNWCGNSGKTALKRVVTNESVLTLIQDRIIESTLLHFMRARKVSFKAEGLRPNTRVFTFLDGENISALTNGAGGHNSFIRYSDTDSDFGNTLRDISVHPDGSSTLVTDADGRVSGTFIVPNNSSTKIRTGTRQFKILDISVDNEIDAGSIAATPYTANGFLDTKQAVYNSTRIVMHQGPLTYIDDGGGDGPDRKGTTLHELGGSVDRYNANKQHANEFAGIVTTPPSIADTEFSRNSYSASMDMSKFGDFVGINNFSNPLSADRAMQDFISNVRHANEYTGLGGPPPSHFGSGRTTFSQDTQDANETMGDGTGLGSTIGSSDGGYHT